MLLKCFPFLSQQLGRLSLWKNILASGTVCSVSIFPTVYFCCNVCLCACLHSPDSRRKAQLLVWVPLSQPATSELTSALWRGDRVTDPLQGGATIKSSPCRSVGLGDSTYARRSQYSPPDTNGDWQRLRTRRHYLPQHALSLHNVLIGQLRWYFLHLRVGAWCTPLHWVFTASGEWHAERAVKNE